jgi:hypothetical protein
VKLGDFLTSINYNKKNLFEENEDFAEKSYVPFVINRCLSYFPDTILHANMMNLHTGVSKRMNYEYYLHSIRKGKRFSKTLKSEVSEDLSLVITHFSVSRTRAKEMLPLLSREFLDDLSNIYLKTH